MYHVIFWIIHTTPHPMILNVHQDDGMYPPSPGWESYIYRKKEKQANSRMQKCYQCFRKAWKSSKSESGKSIKHVFGKFWTFILRKILTFPTDALGAVTVIQPFENNTLHIHYLKTSVIILNQLRISAFLNSC